ncbi:MAG: adenosylcobinamide-GDP ribazoletransferase [Candidatus Rokuibacteriota bacterium]
MAALILAVRFLTVVPMPGREATGPGAIGRAAWWFPVVGVLLGLALAAADWALAPIFPPLVVAALVVALWKAATGGIHLDGLADCLDALGGGNRERRLTIMRDHRIGVFAAAGLALVLLLAVAAVAELPASLRATALIAAPALGRIAPALAGACFPSATPGQGSGADFLIGLSRWAGPAQLAVAVALAPLVLWPGGLALVAAAAGAALAWSAFMARRLGGVTGDVLGGAVECGELAALLAAAALAHAGPR